MTVMGNMADSRAVAWFRNVLATGSVTKPWQ